MKKDVPLLGFVYKWGDKIIQLDEGLVVASTLGAIIRGFEVNKYGNAVLKVQAGDDPAKLKEKILSALDKIGFRVIFQGFIGYTTRAAWDVEPEVTE